MIIKKELNDIMSKKFITIGIIIIILLSSVLVYISYSQKSSDQQRVVQDQVNKQKATGKINNADKGGDSTTKTETVVTGTNVGDMAPDFTLEDLSGNKVTLSKLRGKNVMVNFWATTCPYCRLEMPDINSFYKAHKDNLEVLAIDLGESDSTIKDYIKDKGFEFKILKDTDGSVGYMYGIRFIPTTFFIDKKGIIKAVANGAMTSDEIKQYFSALK